MFQTLRFRAWLLAMPLFLGLAPLASSMPLRELMQLAQLGTEITVTNEYSSFELVELIRAEGSQITVETQGFSGHDLSRLAQAGPAWFRCDSRTTAFDIITLAENAGARVHVDTRGFSTWDLREMANRGARFEVSQQTEIYELLQLLEVAGGRVAIHTEGFRLEELRQLTLKGARLIFGHRCLQHSDPVSTD